MGCSSTTPHPSMPTGAYDASWVPPPWLRTVRVVPPGEPPPAAKSARSSSDASPAPVVNGLPAASMRNAEPPPDASSRTRASASASETSAATKRAAPGTRTASATRGMPLEGERYGGPMAMSDVRAESSGTDLAKASRSRASTTSRAPDGPPPRARRTVSVRAAPDSSSTVRMVRSGNWRSGMCSTVSSSGPASDANGMYVAESCSAWARSTTKRSHQRASSAAAWACECPTVRSSSSRFAWYESAPMASTGSTATVISASRMRRRKDTACPLRRPRAEPLRPFAATARRTFSGG